MIAFSIQEEQRIQELAQMAFDFARHDDHLNLEIMIKAGLNVNLKNHKGDSLLMLASYNNAYETTKMLLEYGAKVDEKNSKGQTPLAGVCFKGYLNICQLLVKYGANIYENNGLGMTPYMFALIFGRKDIIDFFNANSKPSFGKKIISFFMNLFK